MKVMIVEDVDAMSELLAHVIGEIPGLAVSGKARNGAEARLELLRRRPDFVLLDEILPGEASLDLIREFGLHEVPVVLITSLSEERALPAGVLGRILKPAWDSVDQDRARIQSEIFSLLTLRP